MKERNGATAMLDSNLVDVATSEFVDLTVFDAHLAADSSAIAAGSDQGSQLTSSDIDGDERPTMMPDVGADQR